MPVRSGLEHKLEAKFHCRHSIAAHVVSKNSWKGKNFLLLLGGGGGGGAGVFADIGAS